MRVEELEKLKERAGRVRPDLPTSRVIDVLVEHYHGPRTTYSPADISQQLRSYDPKSVLAALLLLDSEPLNAVQSHWVFFDDEGGQFEVSADELEQILASGEFYHPLSGARVYSYEQSIGLLYESGPVLERLLESRNREHPQRSR
jgi:hypothetical protein